jgi:hypothetical protein
MFIPELGVSTREIWRRLGQSVACSSAMFFPDFLSSFERLIMRIILSFGLGRFEVRLSLGGMGRLSRGLMCRSGVFFFWSRKFSE